MDHVRVHPKFLHSNATSHKWAHGAFTELLDNSLDEVCNGATFVNIDMLHNIKDGSEMVVEDDGGGMDLDKMRQCMSLGYSAKSKLVNTIGQYGNGFKTSTMRLGADVIVFSRYHGKNGTRPAFYGRILSVLLGLEPSSSVVKGVRVTGAHHDLKKAFLSCLKCTHPGGAPWCGRLVGAMREMEDGKLVEHATIVSLEARTCESQSTEGSCLHSDSEISRSYQGLS